MSKKFNLPAKRAFKIRFLPQLKGDCVDLTGVKNTSIRTLVRVVGYADNPCAQGGCNLSEKS